MHAKLLRAAFAATWLGCTCLLPAWAQTAATTPAAATPAPDPWAPVQRFIGEWSGAASGQPGEGTVARTYAFVLNKRFINETNVSRYQPKAADKPGEVHEHWGMFSYDKARKLLVLRQFHVEGFVNTYRMAAPGDNPALLVFESEAFENLNSAWKARETYEFISPDEFTETFELSPPGKPFEVYSRNHFRRVKK